MSAFLILLPYVALIIVLSEKIRNLIPDSSTGALGFVRRMFSFVSLHTPNVK